MQDMRSALSKLLIIIASCCASLSDAAGETPMTKALLSYLEDVPEAYKLTYLRENNLDHSRVKCVHYQDGSRFHYEFYLVKENSEPLFHGAFSFDGKVYKGLRGGVLWVSKDPDKVDSIIKMMLPPDPLNYCFLPFVMEEDCLKLLDKNELKAAISALPLKILPGGGDESFDTDVIELKVKNNSKGMPKSATGIVDAFSVDYEFLNDFNFGKLILPGLIKIHKKPVKGGWRGMEAVSVGLDETRKIVKEESEIKPSGFMLKAEESFQIPKQFIQSIVDVDLGITTPLRP